MFLLFAVTSASAESTADDPVQSLPAPTKKSNWKASAFAGCALLAVVGGIFAICWSGGGNTPTPSSHHHGSLCPNTVTADCIAGACIPQETNCASSCCCTDGGWNGQQQVINGTPPCCCVNGGVPPF
ncbi:MAG TPA: hypothetical protein VHL30_00125 [Chlamydiales bacterium]|nr:hypothetical protein [Chlamydiales bacterium]